MMMMMWWPNVRVVNDWPAWAMARDGSTAVVLLLLYFVVAPLLFARLGFCPL